MMVFFQHHSLEKPILFRIMYPTPSWVRYPNGINEFKIFFFIVLGAMADDTNTMVEPIRALGGAPPVFQNSMILSFVIFPSLIYFIL